MAIGWLVALCLKHLLKMLTDKTKVLSCCSHTPVFSLTLFIATLFILMRFLSLLSIRKSSLDRKILAVIGFRVFSHANFLLVWVFITIFLTLLFYLRKLFSFKKIL